MRCKQYTYPNGHGTLKANYKVDHTSKNETMASSFSHRVKEMICTRRKSAGACTHSLAMSRICVVECWCPRSLTGSQNDNIIHCREALCV